MLSLFNQCYFEKTPSDLFWVEPQRGVLCGMHALNNLLQDKIFTRNDWYTLSKEFTIKGRNIDKEYCALTANGSDPELLLYALEKKGYTSRNIKVKYKPYSDDIGAIVAIKNHFFCIKKHDTHWYMIDSLTYKNVTGYYVRIKDIRLFINDPKVLWVHMIMPEISNVMGYDFLNTKQTHNERLESFKRLLERPDGAEQLLKQVEEFETAVKGKYDVTIDPKKV